MKTPGPTRYLMAALALIVLFFPIMMALGLSGDCGLDVPNCGEGRRRIALGLLVAAPLALAYLIYKFIRSSRDSS